MGRLGRAKPHLPVLTKTIAIFPIIYELEGYRFRNDDGSELSATWKAAQDTIININKLITLRLRVLTNITSGGPSLRKLKLQFREVGTSTWIDIL